jgi:replication factor C large subunit
MWVEKYRPTSLAKLVGNEEARIGFLNWLRSWKPGGKAALLVGPPGIGKTTTVHAAADEFSYDVIELNASDVRTKEKLRNALGPSITNQALSGKPMILLDEVDGIFGRNDYGGMEFVMELMENTSVPLVMTANAQDSLKIGKIAYKAEVFRFQRLPPRLVELYLRSIIEKEHVELDERTLQAIVLRSGGDVRSAVNDLQAAALGHLFEAGVPERDRMATINQAFQQLFDATNHAAALLALDSSPVDPKEKVRLIFASLVSSSLDVETRAEGLEALSRADEIVGRIRRTQEWRQLRYLDAILAIGLFNAIHGKRLQFNDDPIPWETKLRLWNEAKYFAQIGRTLGAILNVSRKQFAEAYLPYFTFILAKTEGGEKMLERMGIDESTIKVITKEGKKLLEALR